MITPSIKALTTLFGSVELAREARRLLLASRAELLETEAGAKRCEECYHPPRTSDIRMHCLDALLDGSCGVEAFETKKDGWVDFLNTGDTYSPTIVRWRGNYYVKSWGEIAERHAKESAE
jgi:hypothetical protein